jgi:hypothetical protein
MDHSFRNVVNDDDTARVTASSGSPVAAMIATTNVLDRKWRYKKEILHVSKQMERSMRANTKKLRIKSNIATMDIGKCEGRRIEQKNGNGLVMERPNQGTTGKMMLIPK